MPDPVDDPGAPPPPPVPDAEATARPASTDLPSNVAAALACFPLIGGIIFYILEKRDAFVRFYAMQSIILGAAWLLFVIGWQIVYGILAGIPVIGWLFAIILWLTWAAVNIGFLVVLIIAILKAFSGVRWDMPWIGATARKQVDGS